MSKSDNKKINKILKILNGDSGKHIANVLDKVQIKDSEQIREIVPIEKWVSDPYYIGKDGCDKLYPFWKNLICEIFEGDKQNYTQIVLTGGIGCRPINTTYYETSAGLLKLSEIQNLLDENVKVFINTEVGSEQIIATHNVGYKDTITLTLSDGTIFTGSSDHLLKVFDGNEIKFKKLSDITEHDKILKANNIKCSYNNDYTEDEAYVDSILGDGSISQPDYISYINEHECSFITVINEQYGTDIVGDIEVEGSHTYISDGGLINHNTGKSTCALYIALRKLYELSCYKNIAGLFNMMSNSFTAFLYFSLTKYQAERTGFAQLRSIIDGIPYFNEYFQRNKYRNSTLDFPENVRMFYGSSTGDMIGMNVICAMIDEANFFGNSSSGGTDKDVDIGAVGELYNSVLSRTSSRYTANGVNHSLNIVISSSKFTSSLTSQLYEKSLTDPSIKYARARVWDIKPKGTYTNYFYVFAGNEKFDPFIIDSTETICIKLGISLDPALPVKDAIARLSQEYRLLVDEVPIDFLNIYTNNIIQGLQDFSGMSVAGTGKLFSSYNTFESCVDENVPVLFSKNEFTIETGNNEPSNNIQYYLKGIEFPHKECPRYLHIDIGVANDAYGIACCYKHGTKLVDGVEIPEFFYDFSLRIVPPPAPKRVSISRCHEFIKYMRDNLGLTIGLVSFDQFQSESSRQYLNEIGIKTVYQSVDKTDTQYLFFVDCLYKNCVHFSREFAEAIRKELFDLIWYRSKRKVDHPSDTKHGGMKDRMDAVVGSLYNAYTTKEVNINPNDILNLSMFNSERCDYPTLSSDNFDDLSENGLNGIKVVSAKNLW